VRFAHRQLDGVWGNREVSQLPGVPLAAAHRHVEVVLGNGEVSPAVRRATARTTDVAGESLEVPVEGSSRSEIGANSTPPILMGRAGY
jgi:hypothetical protein